MARGQGCIAVSEEGDLRQVRRPRQRIIVTHAGDSAILAVLFRHPRRPFVILAEGGDPRMRIGFRTVASQESSRGKVRTWGVVIPEEGGGMLNVVIPPKGWEPWLRVG